MATLKRRLARKNASGIYEPVHLETSSGLVICPDGTNLDTALSKKSPIDHTHTGFALTGHTHEIYVPTSRTVNGKPLTDNITLAAGDVGAAASGHTHTLSALGAAASSHTHSGYVPTSRTVNGKALRSNITLGAADVNAVPTTRTVNGKPLSNNITLTPEDIGAASIDDISNISSGFNVVYQLYTTLNIVNNKIDYGSTFPPTIQSIPAKHMIIDSVAVMSGYSNMCLCDSISILNPDELGSIQCSFTTGVGTGTLAHTMECVHLRLNATGKITFMPQDINLNGYDTASVTFKFKIITL